MLADLVAHRHILAIDQGTTNTKVLLFDDRSQNDRAGVAASVDCVPQPGWVEQDPLAIWRSVEDAAAACLSAVAITPDVVAVTNQRESVLVWERASARLGPASWQCRRTSSFCDGLRTAARGNDRAEDRAHDRSALLGVEDWLAAG
jgi:glycerol kinase